MGIKYKNSIINQYHVIKVRLNGPNIMCTTPNDIPNAPKLKVVIIVFRRTLANFESYDFLLYRPITIYNDRYTINTPIQINSQSASNIKMSNSAQHIPTIEKTREIIIYFKTGFILISRPLKT